MLIPKPKHVVLNLSLLYQNSEFTQAIEKHKARINNFGDGIGRYRNTQSEVLLEIPDLSMVDVYALGGYSSENDDIARQFFGKKPTPEELIWFEDALEQSGEELGPAWMEGDSVSRIVKRMEPHIEKLQAIKAEQAKRNA